MRNFNNLKEGLPTSLNEDGLLLSEHTIAQNTCPAAYPQWSFKTEIRYSDSFLQDDGSYPLSPYTNARHLKIDRLLRDAYVPNPFIQNL